MFIAENLPVQIQGALAFNQTFNLDFEGIGVLPIEFDVPVRGAMYLNQPSRWDDFSDAIDKYVLNHELGHFWLARAQVDLGGGRSAITLGRQGAHWSYFMHTGGSPMEGNAWIDNGDGSFTSDPTVSGDFSDLDLYLMGLLPADEVAPWFLIEPTEAFGRTPIDSPDHYAPEPQSRTIFGRRVDLTIDDVIAAEGPRGGPAPSSFRILTLLVAGPEEILTAGDFDRIEDLQARWVTYWSETTRERSDISFDIDDEGLQMPPPADPRWIPGGAR